MALSLIIVSLMSAVSVLAQTTNVPATRPPVITIKPAGTDIDRRAYEFYCNGLILETIGDLDGATMSYRKALEYFAGSHEISLSLANVLFNSRHPDEALDILKTVLPRDARVWELAASCYRMKGDDQSAFDAYHKVIAQDSTNALALSFLAGYFQMSGQIDSAVWAYQQMARTQPNNYRLWFEIGRLRAMQKDMGGAKDAMRQSLTIESGPENSNTLQALVEIYLADQQTDSAKALLQQGLQRDQANIQLHNKLIGVYIQQDSMLQALPHARFVADANPLDRASVRRLGILYYLVDSLPKADTVFTRLVKDGDEDPADFFYLGRIAVDAKNWDRAKENFTRLIKVSDTSASAWAGLAYAYREAGQREKEIETYRTGIEHMHSESGAITLYFGLGAALEQANLIDSSIATFEELIKHAPDNAQALNYLGYMLADRNMRLDYAKDLLTRAISLEPDSPPILDSYGWCQYRLGNLDTALIYLKQAVELDTDATIFDHLGDVYQAMGNVEQARHWWTRALELQPDSAEIRKKLGR